MLRSQRLPLLISQRKSLCWHHGISLTPSRKVWDTHTGEALHTLSHNHIVRAVANCEENSLQMALDELDYESLLERGDTTADGVSSPNLDVD